MIRKLERSAFHTPCHRVVTGLIKREEVGLLSTQLSSHRYHVQYLLSSCPTVLQEQCLPASGTPQGGVSNPGCGHICSWGPCGTQACVKERPGRRKHSQLQLLTLSPQLTPRIPPFPSSPGFITVTLNAPDSGTLAQPVNTSKLTAQLVQWMNNCVGRRHLRF